MKVQRLIVGLLQANCYILWEEASKEAAVIDPGGNASRILTAVKEQSLKVRYIIHTHSHWDHTGASSAVQKSTKAPVVVHALDRKSAGPVRRMLRRGGESIQEVKDGDTLALGKHELKVIHTPGHTTGSICIHVDNMLFAGDLLFQGSVGRWDLKGGSFREIVKSVNQRLAHLPDSTIVYPGHGPETSLGQERMTNPFFKSAQDSIVKQ